VTTVDWRETQRLLRVAFPLAVHAARATYEIAFGVIERATRPGSPYDRAKFEVAFHRWFDLGEHGYGIAMLNDCKYGGVVRDNVASLSLLKSPNYPDPTSDRGVHRFTYSLLPHAGGWREAGVLEESRRLNDPPTLRPGRLDARADWVRVSTPGVMVEALKPAEDGDGFILRLVDYFGQRAETTVTLPRPIASADACTVVEGSKAQPCELVDGNLRFTTRPFGVHSFRVLPQAGER
jgi:alpha-mannosidase